MPTSVSIASSLLNKNCIQPIRIIDRSNTLIMPMHEQIFLLWFFVQKFIVELLKNYVSPMLGLAYGMIVLEAHTLCRAAWYTFYKYRQDPTAYGFNTIHSDRRPVLLLHGAVGSWSYLGDLARALRLAQIPVFVLNHGFGSPTDEIRRKVFAKIEEIRRLINDRSPVDLVAHSNGGNLALACAFTEECSFIDAQGELQFHREPSAYPHVGKIITVALPTSRTELEQVRQIKKENDLFNLNAHYDGLMGHKICALDLQHRVDINSAHIGIVFQKKTYESVLELLLNNRFM